MKQEPIVFATAVEGVKRAFGSRITPALQAQIKALGIDFENVNAAYPFATWYQLNALLMKTLSDPSLTESERYRWLGREFMRGFVQTTVGFATLTMGKLMGIRRTMQRMGRNFRTSANYIDAEVSEDAEGVVIRCLVSPQFVPVMPSGVAEMVIDYRCGLLEETLVILGGKESSVQIIERSNTHFAASYRLRWK